MTTWRFDLNDEYSRKLEEAAAVRRLSVPDYIRYKLFGEMTIFSVDEVIKRIQAGDFEGREFTIPDVFSDEEWSHISKGSAGVLGKNFNAYIMEHPSLGIRFIADKTIKRRAVYTYIIN